MFEFVYENGTRFTVRLKSVTVGYNALGARTVTWADGDEKLSGLKVDGLIAVIERHEDEID